MSEYTEEQRKQIKRFAVAYETWSSIHAMKTSTPHDRANALRVWGRTLLDAQEAVGIELVSEAEIDAVNRVSALAGVG